MYQVCFAKSNTWIRMPFECLINCSIYSRIIDVTGYDWLCFVDAWVVLISTVFVVPLRNRFEVGKPHSG